MRAERAKAESRRDGTMIAQGKRSAALLWGKEPQNECPLFPSLVFPRLKAWGKPNSGKGGPASTQGGGPPVLRSGGPCPATISLPLRGAGVRRSSPCWHQTPSCQKNRQFTLHGEVPEIILIIHSPSIVKQNTGPLPAARHSSLVTRHSSDARGAVGEFFVRFCLPAHISSMKADE